MMKTFTTLFFILLVAAFGAMASPQSGLRDSPAGAPQSLLGRQSEAEGPQKSLHDSEAGNPRNASSLYDSGAGEPRSAFGLSGGEAEVPRSGFSLYEARTAEGRSISGLSGLDIMDFVTALSAQQTRTGAQQAGTAKAAIQNGTALAGKDQPYTMTFDSLHGFSWETRAWLHEYRVVYVYDDLMRPVEARDYLRDSDQGDWRPFSKKVLSYNDQGLLSGLTRTLNWQGAGTMYEHFIIEVYYDRSGRLDSVVTHSADDFQVLNRTTAELFTYDDEGRPERIDALTWDDVDARWKLTSYKQIDYDSEGNRLFIGNYSIGKDKDGHLNWQYEYAYDGEGRLVGEVVSSFNFKSLQIEPVFKEEYMYNDEGDRAEKRVYTYYEGAWEPASLTEYTYDPTINYADVASLGFVYDLLYYDRGVGSYGQPPNKLLAETAYYYYHDGEFVLSSRAINFVSEKSADSESLVTGVADLTLSSPVLYPNPSADHITLEWEGATQERLTLEIYHTTGSLVMRREVESGQQLSIDQLPTGLYIYRLTNGQAITQAGRLVKR